MAAAALYLGFAAIGKLATGHSAFFWMDEDVVGSKEKVTAYCIGFVSMAAASKYKHLLFFSKLGNRADATTVFSMLYGLISMRENVSHTP